MYNHTTKELLAALQYLLIGLLALAITQHWFGHWPSLWQILVWVICDGALSLLRIFMFGLNEWVRGNRWQTIRRRNWD